MGREFGRSPELFALKLLISVDDLNANGKGKSTLNINKPDTPTASTRFGIKLT
jgi:hypothetical protein